MQGIQQNRDSLKLRCWVRWLEHSGTSLIFMILFDTAALAFCCIICFHMYSVDVWNEVLEYLVQTWRLRWGNSEAGVLLCMGKAPMEGQWVTEIFRDKKQTTFEPETSRKDSALLALIWLILQLQMYPWIICMLTMSCSWTSGSFTSTTGKLSAWLSGTKGLQKLLVQPSQHHPHRASRAAVLSNWQKVVVCKAVVGSLARWGGFSVKRNFAGFSSSQLDINEVGVLGFFP